MGIIDFRVRPLYKHYDQGFTNQFVGKFFRAFGYEQPESVRQRCLKLLVDELKNENVEKAVIPGRITFGTTNEELFELQDLYPELFIVYPFLDVTDTEKSLEDIDHYIVTGRGKGASMEPLCGNEIRFDGESIFPIYEKLEKEDIPVLTNVSQLVGSCIDNTIPAQIDRVLTRFPKLKFIAGHAGWPWLNEMVALTFKHPFLYLTADFNGTRGAGNEILRYAALHMASDQVVYASSYPLAPIGGSIQSVRDWRLPADIERKILYENAAGILKLGGEKKWK